MELQSLLCDPHHTELMSHLSIVAQYQICHARLAYFWPLCTAWDFFCLLFISGSPLNFWHQALLFQNSFPCCFPVGALHDPLLSLLQGPMMSALPFATSYCCNIEVSLTIVLCVPLHHEDISSLAKAGPSLCCQELSPFFPVFPFTCQQLYMSAACHLCVWNRESWGFPPAKHQTVTFAFATSLGFTDHPFHTFDLGILKPDQMKIHCMSRRGESIPPGLEDVGSGRRAAAVALPQSHCRACGDTRSAERLPRQPPRREGTPQEQAGVPSACST